MKLTTADNVIGYCEHCEWSSESDTPCMVHCPFNFALVPDDFHCGKFKDELNTETVITTGWIRPDIRDGWAIIVVARKWLKRIAKLEEK